VHRVEHLHLQGPTWCGADGTIAAIEWQLADLVDEPSPAEHLATREETVQGGGSERLVITADAVWMRVSRPKVPGAAPTPSSSRSVMGTTWMGVLALLTDAQLEDAQVRAKYPRRPLLRTGAAWKEALIEQGPIPPRPAP
jgi:hypothetical protein